MRVALGAITRAGRPLAASGRLPLLQHHDLLLPLQEPRDALTHMLLSSAAAANARGEIEPQLTRPELLLLIAVKHLTTKGQSDFLGAGTGRSKGRSGLPITFALAMEEYRLFEKTIDSQHKKAMFHFEQPVMLEALRQLLTLRLLKLTQRRHSQPGAFHSILAVKLPFEHLALTFFPRELVLALESKVLVCPHAISTWGARHLG